ncbi:hypothetical protein C7212DRAFT_343872 [Tuber magnatum]|uniref:Galactose oxidase n=1 Tax=Tuber magnatum TaxID=42249 RepID=A0A317SSX6_9PEZI|nr:hypothetical protein C7212DRAFT_343872 [Tuber magnatum]
MAPRVPFHFVYLPAPPSSSPQTKSTVQPWSLNLTSDFTAEGIDSSSLIARSVAVNTELPYTMRGAFWVSKNGTIYKYGGYYPPEGLWEFSNKTSNVTSIAPRNAEIWELNTKTRNWTKTAQPSGEEFLGARNGGVTSIPEEDTAYFLGGWSGNTTDARLKDWTHGETIAHQSMLVWNMKGNKMSNQTTSFQAVTLSNLVHVPVGNRGLLLSLGGNQFIKSRFNTSDTNECDNSSFNIFMHGGSSPSGDDGFSDTYVLSLPAFQWFRVDTTNKVDRYGVTCHLIKNKMILIGGRGVDQPDPNPQVIMLPGACDPNGIVNIFDVNTLKWDPKFQVSKLENFKVNEKITGGVGIGGGPRGGATKIEPEGGWNSGQLREKFSKVVPKPRTPSPIPEPTRPPNGDMSFIFTAFLFFYLHFHFSRNCVLYVPKKGCSYPPTYLLPAIGSQMPKQGMGLSSPLRVKSWHGSGQFYEQPPGEE